MSSLTRYARTLRFLRPSQLLFQLLRRYTPEGGKRPPAGQRARRDGIDLHPGVEQTASGLAAGEFRFLNAAKSFVPGQADWRCADMPKLWRYNLHYFDFIHDPSRDVAESADLIGSWIESNPPCTTDAWEPYTVSLRLVNWVKFFIWYRNSTDVPDRWLNSLYHQAYWLERNLEWHILANHLLKNVKALLFTGVFFAGRDADRWLRKGTNLFRVQLREQFLADGGHFERSPMYHSIALEDCLDVVNLAQANPDLMEAGLRQETEGVVRRALDFLTDICMPDGDIPLFNDSAVGIAPSPGRLFRYAERLLHYDLPQLSAGLSVRACKESGYYIVRNAGDVLVVDCGPIGPDYQPGHAHCDTLSFELAFDGARVITDSGTFDYEAGIRRSYVRSTAAHNTVRVDEAEQSEVWGVFRVGRRAYPLGASIRLLEAGAIFEGSHTGYRWLPREVIHHRRIEFDPRSWVRVIDKLTGSGEHLLESYVHIHPCFKVLAEGTMAEIRADDGHLVALVEAHGADCWDLEPAWYFPQFGLQFEAVMLKLSRSGSLPLESGYTIRKCSSLDGG